MTREIMLTKRTIGSRDYSIHEDGRSVGRIRYASERSSGVWLWNVTVTIPGAPFGAATSYEEARAAFKTAWLAFKAQHGPEALAMAFAATDHANRPDRDGG